MVHRPQIVYCGLLINTRPVDCGGGANAVRGISHCVLSILNLPYLNVKPEDILLRSIQTVMTKLELIKYVLKAAAHSRDSFDLSMGMWCNHN